MPTATDQPTMRLDDTERDAIRRNGGMAYCPIIRCRGPRGARYRPVRGGFWRTQEQADNQLISMRRRYLVGRQLDAGSAVVLVDAAGNYA